MLYILNPSLFPNTAFENRLQSYYTNFDSMGVDATIVYLLPDSNASVLPHEYKHIKIKYMWKSKGINNSIIRAVWLYINLLKFILGLKTGDIVYTYTINKITSILTKIKGVKVFAEITEHPSIPSGGKLFTLSENQKYIVASRLEKLFVISTALKRLFVLNAISPDKIEIINMTVDTSRFEKLRKENLKNKYIAYCGNASNNKDGVDKLIESFSIVNKTHPDVLLYIIGKVPNSHLENNNIQLAHKLGVLDKIVFTGIVTVDKMPRLLKNASVLVLNRPDSLQAQCGFPTKLGEYLLTENPVVITSVGDIPLFLSDQKNALIASPNNNKEFADKIKWALDNPIKASNIGKKGAEIAMQHFNATKETNKIVKNMMYEKNN